MQLTNQNSKQIRVIGLSGQVRENVCEQVMVWSYPYAYLRLKSNKLLLLLLIIIIFWFYF